MVYWCGSGVQFKTLTKIEGGWRRREGEEKAGGGPLRPSNDRTMEGEKRREGERKAGRKIGRGGQRWLSEGPRGPESLPDRPYFEPIEAR